MDMLETRERLTESALRGLEDVLETMFEAPKMLSNLAAEVPIIGGQYRTRLDHSAFLPIICRAMVAKEKFSQQHPTWPSLPLREAEIEALVKDDDPRANVVGLFASSQSNECWDPDHPRFRPFVSGLMFCQGTPIEIRTNFELRREFPPCELEGMTSGKLYWRSPETLALDRRMAQMVKVHEAREAAGFID